MEREKNVNEKSVDDAFAKLVEAARKWSQDGTPPAPVSFCVRVPNESHCPICADWHDASDIETGYCPNVEEN